ncbi:GDP-mannose 4,6-dehydratase [Yersinia sp. 2466 StPb PI]|uniref:GDP-mannose 4,6-dehydratase n=1 Tax=Yersinia sp. 2466 StPb PI TaxID=3061648 RepID=UPI00355AF964
MTFCFHHISTDESYGDLPHLNSVCIRAALSLHTELTTYVPSCQYSSLKASCDHMACVGCHTYALPTIVTNYPNNDGPYHSSEQLIPLIIFDVLLVKPLSAYRNCEQTSNWLYVEGSMCALYKVVAKGKNCEAYNIAGLNKCQNIEVANDI